MKSYRKALCLVFTIAFALAPFRGMARAASEADYYDEPGVRLLNQPVAEYRARRAALMNEIKDGVVVVLGNVEEDNGIEARYRQNNWIAYLTGVRTPGASLLLVPQGLPSLNGAREIVFIPPRNLQDERWTGIQLAPGEETARGFGVERVMPTQGNAPIISAQGSNSAEDNLMLKLKEAAQLPAFKNAQGQTSMKVYTVAPRNVRNGYVREYQFVEELKKELPGVEIVTGDRSLVRLVGEMRKAKSAAELVLLQKAIDITGEAQRDIVRSLKPGMYEYEVQAILEAAFTRGGAERPGFPSIVGSGLFSTILHYSENHKRIDAGDTVVCDIGAEYSLYTADITRTYPASGKFTERQRAVYQLVLDTQTASAAHWKPGMTMSDLNRFAKEFMSKSPLRAKDVDGKEYSMDHFFIHGLGHYLGMDVHDTGDYARPLRPGEVFTIEPGIYIPTENLGVRIEDDYVITPEQTIRKMSEKIPSTIEEIERLMAVRR
ncbi:MAG: aminopeptidase P N-terminal domain-containing protein [Pyrinomonadaceae bacterium]|nr:aminopeptidase P N-terminal domain-containing protein [Pyrinomonadaceae bacterium]